MKKLMAAVLMSIFLSGCATSHYTKGQEFPSENVPKIVKGTTKGAEIESMFGQPFAKSPINETDEKWTYTYTEGSVHVQSLIVTMNVSNKGTQKTLDVLLRNGTVINYTYTEGPTPGSRPAAE